MAALNKMSNGRGKKDGGQQPLLDDSDSDVQEFAMQTVSPHRSRRKVHGVRVKTGGGGCCRNCIRLTFLIFNLALLGCVGFLGYRGWLLVQDVAKLQARVKTLEDSFKTSDTAVSSIAYKAASLSKNVARKVDELDVSVKTQGTKLDQSFKSVHGDVAKLEASMKESRGKADKTMVDMEANLQKQITELGLNTADGKSSAVTAAHTVLSQVDSVRDAHEALAQDVKAMKSTVTQSMQDVKAMKSTMTQSMQANNRSAQAQFDALRSRHRMFEEGVRLMNTSRAAAMSGMNREMKQTAKSLAGFQAEHETMDSGMRRNMSAMQTGMASMTSDMSALQGKLNSMEGDMTGMANTMNARAAAAAKDSDQPMPTLPPMSTQPQVGLELVQQLNSSLRQSFRKLVGIVRSEHEKRLAQQMNVSRFVDGIQHDVQALSHAVQVMNTTTVEAVRSLAVVSHGAVDEEPTTALSEPDQEPAAAVDTNIGLALKEQSSLLVEAAKKIKALEMKQQEMNRSLATHRSVSLEKFTQLAVALRKAANLGGAGKNVNWTAVVAKYLTSGQLIAALKKVNVTALMPAIRVYIEKLKPVIDEYVQHLLQDPKTKALLEGGAPGGDENAGATGNSDANQETDIGPDEEEEDENTGIEDPGVSRHLTSNGQHHQSSPQSAGEDEEHGEDPGVSRTSSHHRPPLDNADEDPEAHDDVGISTHAPPHHRPLPHPNDNDANEDEDTAAPNDVGISTHSPNIDEQETGDGAGPTEAAADEDEDGTTAAEATDNPLTNLAHTDNAAWRDNEESNQHTEQPQGEDDGIQEDNGEDVPRGDEEPVVTSLQVITMMYDNFRAADTNRDRKLGFKEAVAGLENSDIGEADVTRKVLTTLYAGNKTPVTRLLLKHLMTSMLIEKGKSSP